MTKVINDETGLPGKPMKGVAATLGALLNSAEVLERCREYASRCDGAASLDAAADLLERLDVRRGDRVR